MRARLEPESGTFPATTTEEAHEEFLVAMRSGMKLACMAMTQWVEVRDEHGDLECHWQQTDANGERDNLWRYLGLRARAEQRERSNATRRELGLPELDQQEQDA